MTACSIGENTDDYGLTQKASVAGDSSSVDMSDYDKYLCLPMIKGMKRDGSLSLGDVPLYFRNRIVIEDEVFWQIKWETN